MKTYITNEGDVWDQIAFDTMGSSRHTGALMRANGAHLHISVFPRGITLVIPEIPAAENVTAAPWRREHA